MSISPYVYPLLKYKAPRPNWRKTRVIEAVCSSYGVTIEEIKGKRRNRNKVLPRQVTMYFLRKYTNMGWLEIGTVFRRDHTTAIHSYRAIANLIEFNEPIREQCREIENKILS